MKPSKIVILFALCSLPAAAAERFYQFSVDQDRLSGAPDFSRLNRALTPADRVFVRGAHFSTVGKDLKPNTADDKPVRFFGTNLCFSANFPDPADSPRVAKRMRRLGINLVRLHHTDTNPDREESRAGSLLTQGPYPTLNPTSIARLRALLDAFKAEGIYINLNLHIGYEFRPAVDLVPPLPGAERLPQHSKPLHIFYPRMVQLQTQYAEQVIAALKLKDDPVLAMVEINNETSLSHAWQSGLLDRVVTGEYRAELERQWRQFSAGGDPGPLVSPKDSLPPEQVNRFLTFLIDRDRHYLTAMRDAVRRASDKLVPIAGTQMDFGGLLNLDSHEVLDYVDAHFYIDHYNFPGTPWDSRNWRIRDSSSVGSNLTVFLNEAASRQAGRPYTISEYNQAFPNSHGNEIDATLAALGSFQDWDGLMHFAYAHGRSWDEKTPNGFNLASDTAKLPLFGPSSWLFRTAAVKPGQPLDIPVSQELRLRAARERAGRQVAPFLEKVGGYRPAVALSRAVRLVKDGTGDIPKVEPASAGDIRYDAAARLFLIQAPKAAGVFGFLGRNKATAGAIDLELAPASGEFVTLMVIPLDERPIAKSARLLVSMPGKVLRSRAGTQEPLKLVNYPGTTDWWTLPKEDPNQERPSAPYAGGSGPLWMERVQSTLTLRTGAKAITVYPLDGAGARLRALAAGDVQKVAGGFRIHLQGDGQELSPWFEIVGR
jgi:hypothetical protein